MRQRSQGFSLVEVMVALAVMSIMAVGMSSVFTDLHRQMKAIRQKQDVVDFKNIATILLAKNDICSWQLKDKTINASSVTVTNPAVSTVLALNTLYGGTTSASSILASSGKPLHQSSNGVLVSALTLKNIKATSPLSSPDEFMGTIEVSLEPKSLVYQVRPINIPIFFVTRSADAKSAKRIQSCGSEQNDLSKNQIFPGYPNNINCNGTAWNILSPGVYHCFGGGESTTRSAEMSFNPSTRRFSNCNDKTNSACGECGGPSGDCRTKTLDELMAAGLAK